ncbi:MAG: heme-binding domain-containing protein [Bacteroidetes bacterium]|nr:heme-binding domain-containing protein [Bacteroidota bacterium]
MKKKIALGFIALLVIIQFIRIDKTNPAIVKENDFISITNPPEHIQQMLKASCYDCHSNESTYPWYTNVAPISWWVKQHINEAREELNFSEWGTFNVKRQKHKLEEGAEMIEEGEMPMSSYTLIHDNAKLSDTQKAELIAWFKTEKEK